MLVYLTPAHIVFTRKPDSWGQRLQEIDMTTSILGPLGASLGIWGSGSGCAEYGGHDSARPEQLPFRIAGFFVTWLRLRHLRPSLSEDSLSHVTFLDL